MIFTPKREGCMIHRKFTIILQDSRSNCKHLLKENRVEIKYSPSTVNCNPCNVLSNILLRFSLFSAVVVAIANRSVPLGCLERIGLKHTIYLNISLNFLSSRKIYNVLNEALKLSLLRYFSCD